MSRASIPKPTWEQVKADPDGWRLRYLEADVTLGEPALVKGEVPTDSYADASHLLWDHATLSTILVRKQGPNPIEVRIGEPDPITGTTPPWTPILDCPYFGPESKPVFPDESIWAAWN